MAQPEQPPWYQIVDQDASLEQGELLDLYPIPIIPQAVADLPLDVTIARLDTQIPLERFNVVVLTQSCDIMKLADDDDLLLCPRYDYLAIAAERPELSGKAWSHLVKGYFIGLHVIKECTIPGRAFPYQVVEIRRVFTSPLRLGKKIAASKSPRIRLAPPYREHLGQAFARQFMRVGLPEDLPAENPYS